MRRFVVVAVVVAVAAALVVVDVGGVASAATAVVNQPKVNVRSGPGTTYSKVGEASAGDRLEVIETRGEWLKVRLPSGKEGWVWSPLVDRQIESESTVFVITTDRANLRKGPSTSDALVGTASRGTSLRALAIRGQWVMVAWGAGRAWVYAPLGQIRTLDPDDLLVRDVDRIVRVTRANVPMRSWADPSASIVARLPSGASAKYLSSEAGWVQVHWNGKTGWIDGKDGRVANVAPLSKSVDYTVSAKEWAIRPASLGKVTGSYVNLRSGPGTSYKQIGRLKGGQSFKVLSSQSGWYQVTSDTGQTGWISASLATVTYTPVVRAVSLRASSAYSKQLVIEGSFGSPIIGQVNDGKTLAVWAQNKGGSPSRLDLNSFELASICLNENGIRVDFNEKPSLKVVESKPGRIVVNLETVVTGVTVERKADRDVVSVSTLGYVDVRLSPRDGGSGIEVLLPGAGLSARPQSGAAGRFVKTISVGKTDAGVSVLVDVASWQRHVARRTPNLLTVEFLKAGLAGKTIVIDPGHGGRDPGAIGPSGLYEKAPNLRIALSLKGMLEREGARVIMTRSDDSAPEPLEDGEDVGHTGNLAARVALVTSSSADLFLSIHNNANNDRTKSGTTVYYSTSTINAQASAALAQAVQSELVRALGRGDNGVRTAEYYVTRTCPVPSALAEVLFISNPEEESLLKSEEYCRRAAAGLLSGLKKYYS